MVFELALEIRCCYGYLFLFLFYIFIGTGRLTEPGNVPVLKTEAVLWTRGFKSYIFRKLENIMLGWILLIIAIIGFGFSLHHFMVKWTTYRVLKDVNKRIGKLDIYEIETLLGKHR